MTDMLILGRRLRAGPGRPRSAETLERVSTRVPVTDFNRLKTLAEAERVSMSEMLRRLVVRNR